MRKFLLSELAEIKLCIASAPKNKDFTESVKWIMQSSLLPFNEINPVFSSEYSPNEDMKAIKNDILVRRLSPSGVNIIEGDINAYVYNNIIIIRANESVCADYLAAYLDENIEAFVKTYAKGAIVSSISRKDLMEMPIDLPDAATQRAVGGYWLMYNKKKRLEKKLTELEGKKNKEIFNLIMTTNGGIQ